MRLAALTSSLLIVAGTALLGASCRDVVAGDSLRDASEELCSTLQRCYGADAYDCGVIDERFGRDQTDDQKFLAAFDAQCTESCPGARDCLDRAPICAGASAECGATVGCCNAGLGLLRCDALPTKSLGSSSGGACCVPDGVSCADSPDACCTSCIDGFCGGFECKTEKQACRSSLECCSRFCDPESRTCERRTCATIGDSCLTGADCCPPDVQSNVAPPTIACLDSGVCGYPPQVKGQAGSPCLVDGDCESNQCFPVEGSDERRCAGTDGCLPELVDCQSDADCCQGGEPGVPEGATPLLCNLSADTPRCEPNYTCDDPTGCCTIAGSPCEVGTECCSGVCSANGQCASSEAPACAARVCHGLCQVGAPMELGAPGDALGLCLTGGARAECIADVVLEDDFCGCYQWDQVCVELARSLCGKAGDPCLL